MTHPYNRKMDELEAEIERLRAILQQIADNEYSGYGGIGGIARGALNQQLETKE